VVKTAGTRRGDTVGGVMDDCTGRFLAQGHEGRLNAESYRALRARVVEQTTPHIMLRQAGAP
jgi:hypothetical protein